MGNRTKVLHNAEPTLRGALLGLEIGTSQSTLSVGAGRFGRTPHIALSEGFLALHASDCNGWPRRWVRDDGGIGTQEETAVFRRKLLPRLPPREERAGVRRAALAPMKSPHPSPLPVRRGEGEATASFLAFPNKRQCPIG